MDEPNIPVRQMSCYKCGFQADTTASLCPQCNGLLQTSRSIRIRGSLLALCGGSLVLFMGYIGWWMLGAAINTSPLGPRFNGTMEQARMIAALVGIVIVFGLASFVTGVWQLAFGKRNRVFVWGVCSLAALLFVLAGYFILKSQ